MNPPRSPRRLPWTGPDGKPCYVIGDGTGPVSRLADEVETVRLGLARQVLERARGALCGPPPAPEELGVLAASLVEALREALRIAEARGPA